MNQLLLLWTCDRARSTPSHIVGPLQLSQSPENAKDLAGWFLACPVHTDFILAINEALERTSVVAQYRHHSKAFLIE
eukprot:1157370-Pelagomonas_calceolata.AAC.4